MTGEEKAIQMFKSMLEAKPQLDTCGVINKYDFRVGEEFFDNLKIAITALTTIEDIKTDIKHLKDLPGGTYDFNAGLERALIIIDKHLGKEQE